MHRITYHVSSNTSRFSAVVSFLVILTFAVTATGYPGAGEINSDPVGEARHSAVISWGAGLGDAEYGRLAIRFKVTFMRIDVADIEALVTAAEAASLGGLVREGKAKRPRIERAAAVLLAADTVAFRFIFVRDGGVGRFLKGTRKNLEAAVEAGVIDESEYDLVWDGFQQNMAAIAERGSRKGDQLLYRAQNGSLRMVYLGIDGDVLIDATHTEEGWVRGIKGLFLARDSSSGTS